MLVQVLGERGERNLPRAQVWVSEHSRGAVVRVGATAPELSPTYTVVGFHMQAG